MDETIERTLRDMERKEHIRVMHAVESGSWAWDVRCVCIRRPEDCLRVDGIRDTIEGPLASMQHDRTMAEGDWRAHLEGEQVKLPKDLYVLRPVLCCSGGRRRRSTNPE